MTISVIITAGGSSSRFGKNKLLEKIGDKTVIEQAIEAFCGFNEIIVSANDETAKYIKGVKVVKGGKTRQESVYNALKALNNPEYVLIHDGARPFISQDVIKKVCEEVKKHKAVVVAVKVKDTIKEVADGKVIKTLKRETLWQAQTPQAFEYDLIMKAHERLKGENYTDDAGMVESLGGEVFICEGEYSNIKITTPDDLNCNKT